MRSIARFFSLASIIIALVYCQGCKNPNNTNSSSTGSNDTTAIIKAVKVPDFSADSAYADVARQVAFGPRVPGTEAQRACAKWMQEKLKAVCDTVYLQDVHVTGGDGKQLPCYNLVGVIHPKATKRILFLTHWDSRPWADMDTKDKDTPIMAADDGGSGVGVLLEVAQAIKTQAMPESLGIDILFTDVEDYGRSMWGDNSYCLGTQYWAHHPHVPGYKADFGILLDMVGARDARFPMEGRSSDYAPDVQKNVWDAASRAGYSSYFSFRNSAEITDDHVPVNEILHIPTIDIINLSGTGDQVFAPHWHTHQDNMQIIDKGTLKAVGQTLLQVIYETDATGVAKQQ